MADARVTLQQMFDTAIAHHQRGELDRAEPLYQRILEREPASFAPRHMLGVIRAQQGRNEEAIALITAALQRNPAIADAWINLGNVQAACGRHQDAAESFGHAARLAPALIEAHLNRGIALARLGRPAEALASYDSALALKPDLAAALNNRGLALRDLSRFDEALESCDRALALAPGDAAAWSNRGKILCEQNRIADGLEAYVRAAELLCGSGYDGGTAEHRRRHDEEQKGWLMAQGIQPSGSALRLEGGERLAGRAVNPANAALAAQWQTQSPQIAVIDNLLTPEALEALRRFCWTSNHWRNVYAEGYLGAFPEIGFACPLLAQIAEELRDTFPAIFRDHPLRYHWAFKYDSRMSGIALHADEAAVNVNFWITPDAANLDPDSGGMVVWDKAAPLEWDFARFNADAGAAEDFLRRSGAVATTIPYRANRAVIFDSNLFHKTDDIRFAEGYQNRRINVTMLYGRRGS